jgi:hypothetical protein
VEYKNYSLKINRTNECTPKITTSPSIYGESKRYANRNKRGGGEGMGGMVWQGQVIK